MNLKARLVASAEVAKNCDESDMAILATRDPGLHLIHASVTPGSYAVNLVP
jgi:hypothetical protein